MLEESFDPKAIYSILDRFLEWGKMNAQIDQFLGGVLRSHQPILLVFLDSDAKKKKSANGVSIVHLMER